MAHDGGWRSVAVTEFDRGAPQALAQQLAAYPPKSGALGQAPLPSGLAPREGAGGESAALERLVGALTALTQRQTASGLSAPRYHGEAATAVPKASQGAPIRPGTARPAQVTTAAGRTKDVVRASRSTLALVAARLAARFAEPPSNPPPVTSTRTPARARIVGALIGAEAGAAVGLAALGGRLLAPLATTALGAAAGALAAVAPGEVRRAPSASSLRRRLRSAKP